MRLLTLSELSTAKRAALLLRPAIDHEKAVSVATEIFAAVAREGDSALKRYTETFDGVALNKLEVDPKEMALAGKKLSAGVHRAFDRAAKNIRLFHAMQLPAKEGKVVTQPGITCFREARAIERVGLYVPGGRALLPSTVLMLGIPATLAGCSERVMVTPPRKDGTLSPEMLYAAKLAGITRIFALGGAQAIAALSLGTRSVPKVDKLFGPGNQYVTAAKMYAASLPGGPAIDMPAGPSEVLVIADKDADPAYVASDLLSQAEHGPDSQAVCVSTDVALLRRVQAEVERQSAFLSRKDSLTSSLKGSLLLLADSLEEAFAFSNAYAPEHLILNIAKARNYVKWVQNAGSVFLGPYTPESLGDYASGTNHTLPTYGAARAYSGVSVDMFYKKITFQEATQAGLRGIAKTVTTMAEVEGLDAHAQAITVRL